MSNYFIPFVVGVSILGGFIYKNSENIKIEIMRQQGIYKAKKIARDFFIEKLKENPKITLDNAILKFEDTKNEFKILDEFSKNKTRTVESYRKAYSTMFNEAKKRIN